MKAGMSVHKQNLSIIRRLCLSSIETGISKLCKIRTWPRPPRARTLRPGNDFSRNELNNIQEVKDFINYSASDEKLKSIYSNKYFELHIYEYWEQLLLRILRETEGTSPSKRVFNKWFSRFVKELFTETATWKSIDTIAGLTLHAAKLRFDQDTILTSISADDLMRNAWGELHYVPLDDEIALRSSNAALITTMTLPKKEYSGIHKPGSSMKRIIRHSSAIKAIRLAKPGIPQIICHLEFQVSPFPISDPFVYGDRESKFYTLGEASVIERVDFKEIKNLWLELISIGTEPYSSKNIIDMACNRFMRTYEYQNYFDSIVDLTIALESLFGPKDNQELSYRISLRAAWLLSKGQIPKKHVNIGQNEIYDGVRAMYDIRSAIVHGEIAKEKKICRWIQILSGTECNNPHDTQGWEIALESARDIVRKAIKACIRLQKSEAPHPHWQFPKNFDSYILIPCQRKIWQKAAGIK